MTPSSVCRARGTVALLLLTAAAACDGPSRTPTQLAQERPAQSKEVRLKDADAVLMVRTPSAAAGERGGTTLLLDAAIFSKKGKIHPNKQEKFYEWTTSDPTVVTVDSTGLVLAVGVGNAFVIVDYKDMADTIDITVIPVPVASVTASGPDSLSLDDTASYSAVTLDSAGAPLIGRTVAWRSSAPAALTMDGATGVGIALAEGTVIVTAECEGKSASVTTKIWPQPVATIEVAPSVVSVALYRGTVTFTATPRDWRGKPLIGRVLTWWSSSTGTFTIDPLSGVATTLSPGAGDAIAESEGVRGMARLTVTNPVEARVLWVTRFDFSTAAHVQQIIQRAKAARFNAVYFQVRTAGDALYRSNVEPCSPRICTNTAGVGTLGGPIMRFDPLAVAIQEAGTEIEVHAWLNSMTAWISGSAASTVCGALVSSTPLHLALARPQYVMTSISGVVTPCATTAEYIWFSPGVPQVRTRLAEVASDILRTYPGVKGIHLDRIRYPSASFSYDTASVNAYKRANNGVAPGQFTAAWAEFRRGFVNAAVREVYDSMRVVRPAAVLSAAIWPIYQAMPTWGSHSKGYSDYFQDPRAWTAGKYLDVAAPMLYPALASSESYVVKPTYCASLDWHCLFDQHRQAIETGHARHVYAGIGAIKGWPEMSKQIAIARQSGATGISVYSYGTLNAISPSAWTELANGYFKYPATIPPMSWK